jgi:hypothetical protein
MGGSGAGSGGSAAVPGCDAPAALAVVAGSEAGLSAIAADGGSAPDAACPALAVPGAVAAPLTGLSAIAADAALLAVAAPGCVAEAALGAAGAMPSGSAGPPGAAENVLGGSGGRDGAPVEDVLVAADFGGGICASRTVLTLVSLFADA